MTREHLEIIKMRAAQRIERHHSSAHLRAHLQQSRKDVVELLAYLEACGAKCDEILAQLKTKGELT